MLADQCDSGNGGFGHTRQLSKAFLVLGEPDIISVNLTIITSSSGHVQFPMYANEMKQQKDQKETPFRAR